jgi:hypothetical protein
MSNTLIPTKWKVKSSSGFTRSAEISNHLIYNLPEFVQEERRDEKLLSSFEVSKHLSSAGINLTILKNTGKRMQSYSTELGKTEIEMLIAYLQQQLPNCRDYHYEEVIEKEFPKEENQQEQPSEPEQPTPIPSETFMTLQCWKDENHKEGFSQCSKNIDKSGYVRFTGVDSNWWIHCPDANGGNGQSFSSHPNEIVYLQKPQA